MKRKVIVIGAGASGLVAAISAARQGAFVTILEHNNKPGKKLLLTGNGRCNLLNTNQGSAFYHSENSEIINCVCSELSIDDALDFYKSLGLNLFDKDGYMYPTSNQSASVLDALLSECDRLNVKIKCNNNVEKILTNEYGFNVKTIDYTYISDRVIVACGSKAASYTGSNGTGYEILRELGHTLVEPLPALTSVICSNDYCNKLAGVRAKAKITLKWDDGVEFDVGEIQFTSNGLSGIPMFQLSRYASIAKSRNQECLASLDLFTYMSAHELYSALTKLKSLYPNRAIISVLTGFINVKLAGVIITESNMVPSAICESISNQQLYIISNKIKNFEFNIKQIAVFDNAQVCRGGIDTTEINYKTMESKVISDLYITGEIMDVDAKCGGYNLFWAWATGLLAGNSAGSSD